MIVNLDQISWKYRAEGNANLVLALNRTQKVLRLKKVDTVDPHRGDANGNFQFLKSVVDYIKEISTLLLEDFIIDPQLVILLVKDMEMFNKQLNQWRPGENSKGKNLQVADFCIPSISSRSPVQRDSLPFRNNVSGCDIPAAVSHCKCKGQSELICGRAGRFQSNHILTTLSVAAAIIVFTERTNRADILRGN